MEELIPKMLEYGALAVITIFLIVRGVKAIQDLTESTSNLTVAVNKINDAVDKLASKVEKISDRQISLESEIKLLGARLEKLESNFENNIRDLRNLIERKFQDAKN